MCVHVAHVLKKRKVIFKSVAFQSRILTAVLAEAPQNSEKT
jgi:hypothetical protein